MAPTKEHHHDDGQMEHAYQNAELHAATLVCRVDQIDLDVVYQDAGISISAIQ
jgi:hypothetical protein